MCGLKNYNLEEEIENVIKLKDLYIRARESLPALIMASPLKSEEIQKLDSLLEKSIKVCDKTLYSKDLCEGLFIDFRFSMDIISRELLKFEKKIFSDEEDWDIGTKFYGDPSRN